MNILCHILPFAVQIHLNSLFLLKKVLDSLLILNRHKIWLQSQNELIKYLNTDVLHHNEKIKIESQYQQSSKISHLHLQKMTNFLVTW